MCVWAKQLKQFLLLVFLSLLFPSRPRYRCWNCFKLELPNVHGKWILKKVSTNKLAMLTGESNVTMPTDAINYVWIKTKLACYEIFGWCYYMIATYTQCTYITSKLRTKHILFVWLICDKSIHCSRDICKRKMYLQKVQEQIKVDRKYKIIWFSSMFRTNLCHFEEQKENELCKILFCIR